MTPQTASDRSGVIYVDDYDPAWATTFLRLRDRVWPAVSDIAVAIEHVGSTAVPGLAAKPILDIDIILKSMDLLNTVIKRLEPLGYVHRGNLGIIGREAFAAPSDEVQHHLYVCDQNGEALRNHLILRDHLRANSSDAAEYSALKKKLAHDFPFDIDRYIAGKTEFILAILRQHGVADDSLAAIRLANEATVT